MGYTIIFDPTVKDDVSALDSAIRERIKGAIVNRLTTEPAKYGKPLRGTLGGYWKLRVGDWRVVYVIHENEVIVFAIKHRSRVYEEVGGRCL